GSAVLELLDGTALALPGPNEDRSEAAGQQQREREQPSWDADITQRQGGHCAGGHGDTPQCDVSSSAVSLARAARPSAPGARMRIFLYTRATPRASPCHSSTATIWRR